MQILNPLEEALLEVYVLYNVPTVVDTRCEVHQPGRTRARTNQKKIPSKTREWIMYMIDRCNRTDTHTHRQRADSHPPRTPNPRPVLRRVSARLFSVRPQRAYTKTKRRDETEVKPAGASSERGHTRVQANRARSLVEGTWLASKKYTRALGAVEPAVTLPGRGISVV